jgi:hypothetical protein
VCLQYAVSSFVGDGGSSFLVHPLVAVVSCDNIGMLAVRCKGKGKVVPVIN